MKRDTTKPADAAAEEKLFDNWFDPAETGLRAKVRGFIETMIEEELDTALSRPRYGRRLELTAADNAAVPVAGHRHGHRMRSLTGTFGPAQIAVPRARIIGEDGKTAEWKCKSPRAYQRRARQADALIAGTYLGFNQPAPGPPGARGFVCRGGRQGRGQQGLAESEDRLGGLEQARSVQ